jgi:hypothetical protein
MQRGGANELLIQFGADARGKHGDAVVLPFRIAHGELAACEVDVLNAEGQRFKQ